MISCMNRKQDSVALSSSEAKYIVPSEVGREFFLLRKLLSDLFEGPLDRTIIHYENKSFIRLKEDPIFHVRPKHMISKYHYIRILV